MAMDELPDLEDVEIDHDLVVRNTFIDAIPAVSDEDTTGLHRVNSDPGGQSLRHFIPLCRIPGRQGLSRDQAGNITGVPGETPRVVPRFAMPLGSLQQAPHGLPLSQPPLQSEPPAEDDDQPLHRTVSVGRGQAGQPRVPEAVAAGREVEAGREVAALNASFPGDVRPQDRVVATESSPGRGLAARWTARRGQASASTNSGYGEAPATTSTQPSGCLADWSDRGPASRAAPRVDATLSLRFASEPSATRGSGQAVMPGGFGDRHSQLVDVERGSLHDYEIAEATRGGGIAEAMALAGPPYGQLHAFHQETVEMGRVSSDFRNFTKAGYEGRLSVVSESQVHTGGVHRYLLQFSGAELSKADGVGFVFSSRLPCSKNIQRIVSIFVNQRGRICMRVCTEILRVQAYMKALENGDWIEMTVDLDRKIVLFNIWPRAAWIAGTRPISAVEFAFGDKLQQMLSRLKGNSNDKRIKPDTGHLACVVKNIGTTVILGS